MRRVGAREHDRCIYRAEHLGKRVPRRRTALTEHVLAPLRRNRFCQHVDDAQVHGAGVHHLVTQVRDQLIEVSGTGNREKTLAGLQIEPLHDMRSQRLPLHREARRHGLGKGAHRHDEQDSTADRAAGEAVSATKQLAAAPLPRDRAGIRR